MTPDECIPPGAPWQDRYRICRYISDGGLPIPFRGPSGSFSGNLFPDNYLYLPRQNLRCKSAAARQSRARKRHIPINRSQKRAFTQIIVSFFRETVSFVPEKWAIGG
jgi:hypothetical protein